MTRDEQEAIRKLCEHFLIMCPTSQSTNPVFGRDTMVT
jgi:hypothetical protein